MGRSTASLKNTITTSSGQPRFVGAASRPQEGHDYYNTLNVSAMVANKLMEV
jgi:hypothetical protein